MKIEGAAAPDILQQQYRKPETAVQEPGKIRREGSPVGQQLPEQLDRKAQAEKLKEAVGKINKTMDTYGTELRFSVDEDSGERMVKVINTSDKSVIREIPPDYVLKIVAHVKEMLGIIIDKFI